MERFPYAPGAERALLGSGVIMLAAAGVLAVADRADFIGVPLPPWAHLLVVALAAAMGVRFVTWARARTRSDDPAVAIEADVLHLHVHPGRRSTLRRDEIVDVGTIVPTERIAPRLSLGERNFRIHTTASGLRAVDLRVGERMVDAPLEDVRAAVIAFASGGGPGGA